MLFRKTTDNIRAGIAGTVAVPSKTAMTLAGFAMIIGVAALVVAVAALVRRV
jgi:hypothetical protein